LIEDDRTLRRVFELYLLGDYAVRTFGHGAEAISAMETTPADVVISDINLPEMDGFELHRRLATGMNGRSPRFIFLSSYDDSDTLDQARKLGVDAFLVKPVNRGELVNAIERALAAA
jgi:CheY-like chemotaxis protein